MDEYLEVELLIYFVIKITIKLNIKYTTNITLDKIKHAINKIYIYQDTLFHMKIYNYYYVDQK